MKILMICGHMHTLLCNKLHKGDIVNSKKLNILEAIKSIDEYSGVDTILICDENSQVLNENTYDCFLNFLEQMSRLSTKTIVVYIFTNDISMMKNIEKVLINKITIKAYCTSLMRIPFVVVENTLKDCKTQKAITKEVNQQIEQVHKESKRSFFDRFRAKPIEQKIETTDELTKELNKISSGISRVVAVTGHRGSGITSSVVNIAYEANNRGISTIIVDLDLEYRATNLYVNAFNDVAIEDEVINASLIRTLAKPQNYETTSYNIKDKLWITALGYDFKDKRLVEQFFNANKLIGMLSVLRQKFNLVIIDFPMDLLKNMSDVLIHIDIFAMCVPNNLYGVLSTLRNIKTIMNNDEAAFINAKTRVIVTKYNLGSKFQGDIISPQKVCELLTSELSDFFNEEVGLAGYVEYCDAFDSQIETDLPIVYTNMQYKTYFGNILLRLMEGAK